VARQEKSAVAYERKSAEAEAPAPAAAAKPAAQPSRISARRAADKEQVRADEKRGSASKQAAALKERARKAEKLFAERKWGQAAAAFRALIAAAPSSPSAQNWRERMMAAEQALKPAPAVKAQKGADALDGL
jgi:hypothetical protein